MLTGLLIIPILGVITIFLVGENDLLQKQVALISSLINFVLSLVLWANFDFSYYGFQFVTELSPFVWGRLGLDGISIFFVLLTTFTIPICILSSWDSIKVGIKYFFNSFFNSGNIIDCRIYCFRFTTILYLFRKHFNSDVFNYWNFWS